MFETTSQPFAENHQHMRLSEIMVDSQSSPGQGLDILDQTSMTPVQAPYRYGDVSKPSLSGWWFQPTPLKNMSQLGWWHSIPNWMESHNPVMFQITNQLYMTGGITIHKPAIYWASNELPRTWTPLPLIRSRSPSPARHWHRHRLLF